jgi:hypothetical protein
MKSALLQLLLLRGPIWQRLFLISFYGISITSIFAIGFVCSFPPPGSYAAFSDRMDRAMMVPAMFLLPIDAFSLLFWIVGFVMMLSSLLSKHIRYYISAWSLFLAPTSFLVTSFIYSGIFSGRFRALHEALYRAPSLL